MGDQADDILTSFGLSDGDKRSMIRLKISLRNILSHVERESTSEQNSIRGDNSQVNPSMIMALSNTVNTGTHVKK